MNLTIYLYFLAAFLCAMGVGGVLFPRIILISKRKRILDRPNGRKVHVSKIPRLGGFAFYPAILVSYWVMRGLFSMFDFNLPVLTVEEMLFFFAGITIIYYIGMADDIVGLPYRTKFLYQFLSAALLVLPLNYLADWQGVLGVHATPFWIGIPFTVLLIVALINSYNLIDGVDGLWKYLFGFVGGMQSRSADCLFCIQCFRAPDENLYGRQRFFVVGLFGGISRFGIDRWYATAPNAGLC